MALVPRVMEGRVREGMRTSGAVAVTGPRQAGKTTLARQLQAAGLALHFFSLDDVATRAAARADPQGFALSLPRPAVVDEVQRVPGLLAGIARILARDPTPGQFLLTSSIELQPSGRADAWSLGRAEPRSTGSPEPRSPGSAAAHAPGRAAGHAPGRGRAPEAAELLHVTLWPLAQAELVGTQASVIDSLLEGAPPAVIGAGRGRAATAELVLAGGFPAACVMTARGRSRYFHDYAREVVERDVPEVGEVRLDPSKLAQLLCLLATRTGAAVNHAALARELQVDGKTVKSHVELLARLLLLWRLPAWPSDVGARRVKAARMLLCDSGMAAALAGIEADAYSAPAGGPLARMLIETFAVMELVKQATWSAAPVALSFYRDTERRTVDLVIESRGGDIAGVCATALASTDVLDTRGLRLLRDRLGPRFRAGVVVYLGEDTVQIDDRLWALPLAGLLG